MLRHKFKTKKNHLNHKERAKDRPTLHIMHEF